jgi:hypothetical protein
VLQPLTNANYMETLMSIANMAKCSDVQAQLMNVISLTARRNDCHSVNDASQRYRGDCGGPAPAVGRPSLMYTPSTGCFKKRFTTLKAAINLFRGHAQCFELS